MLFTCQRARAVWTTLGIWSKVEETLRVDRSISIVIQEVLRIGGTLPKTNGMGFAELILFGGWYIWWERRKVIHGESKKKALKIGYVHRNNGEQFYEGKRRIRT